MSSKKACVKEKERNREPGREDNRLIQGGNDLKLNR